MRELLIVVAALSFLCAMYYVTHTGCFNGSSFNVVISDRTLSHVDMLNDRSSINITLNNSSKAVEPETHPVALNMKSSFNLKSRRKPYTTVYHLALTSSTYFMSSEGYPNNTMVMLFTAEKLFKKTVYCWSRNQLQTVITKAQVLPVTTRHNGRCQWTAYVATCFSANRPTEFGLTEPVDEKVLKMPFRIPVEEKLPVVACFAPIFYNERWQVLAALVEIYRQYGVNMQVFYIESALTSIMNYLQTYVSRGLVRTEPWYLVPLNGSEYGLQYDPHLELDWRNQAGAHTDCLINFKNAADFIMFHDVDEILFPRFGKTYLDEFLHFAQQYPDASGFEYPRYNTVFSTSVSPNDFSLLEMLNSSVILDEWATQKCVARPSRVETMWLHWPGHNAKGWKTVDINENDNFMIHLRKWKNVDKITGRRPEFLAKDHKPQKEAPFAHQLDFLLPRDAFAGVQMHFTDFIQTSASKEFPQLPTKVHYYSMFEDCYRQQFYDRKVPVDFCPSPLRCNIPEIAGLQCSVASVPYAHNALGLRLIVHYPTKAGSFEVSPNGCRS